MIVKLEELNSTQQKILAILPKPISLLSLACSIILIYKIYKSSRRRRLYHRLIFVMMIMNLIASSVSFVGTWAFPSDTKFFLASGTKASCTLQGILYTFSGASFALYYSILSFASRFAIRQDFNEAKLLSYEPWFHVIALIIPLLMTIVLASSDLIRPYGPWCAPVRRETCQKYICPDQRDSLLAFVALLFLVFLFILVVCNTIYVGFLAKKKIRQGYHFTGRRRIIEQLTNHRVKVVTVQCSLYICCFGIWGLSSLSGRIFLALRKDPPFIWVLIWIILTCFHGIMLIFVYELTRSKIRKSPILSELWEPITNSSQAANTTVDGIRRSITMKNPQHQNRTPTEETIKVTFSIFDGTPDPSSTWAMFIHSDDSSSDEIDCDYEQGFVQQDEQDDDTLNA